MVADRVESKGRHEGFTKFQQIVTLDEQSDDGSLHPQVHEEVTPQRQTLSLITKGLHSESDGNCKIQRQIYHQQHFSSRQQTTERISSENLRLN